ncbi:MAG: hypothetical protein HRU19_19300 [Pseudobacteriovorax sp.]|nr:hypothetical protein [Pseudobacteriovorax sp.]
MKKFLTLIMMGLSYVGHGTEVEIISSTDDQVVVGASKSIEFGVRDCREGARLEAEFIKANVGLLTEAILATNFNSLVDLEDNICPNGFVPTNPQIIDGTNWTLEANAEITGDLSSTDSSTGDGTSSEDVSKKTWKISLKLTGNLDNQTTTVVCKSMLDLSIATNIHEKAFEMWRSQNGPSRLSEACTL